MRKKVVNVVKVDATTNLIMESAFIAVRRWQKFSWKKPAKTAKAADVKRF